MEWNYSVRKVAVAVFALCIILNIMMVHLQLFHIKTFNHIVKFVQNDTNYAKNLLYKTYQELKNLDFFRYKIPFGRFQGKELDVNVNASKSYDLVIFTSFIPTAKRFIVYNNTKYNWPSVGDKVKTVLFTNNSVLGSEFFKAGWDIISLTGVSESGTPILKYMYMEVAKRYNSRFIGFSNADILFTDSLVKTFEVLRSHFLFTNTHIMVTGRRTNVNNVTKDEAKTFKSLIKISKRRGTLFRPDAEDYFFTDRFFPWENEPDLVIGRVAYDNFLLLHSRMLKFSTVDATQTVSAIHQTVDKGHLEEKWKTTNKEFSYNKLIIQKYFRHVNYYAGMTTCLGFEMIMKDKKIVLRKRQRFPKYCSFRTTPNAVSKDRKQKLQPKPIVNITQVLSTLKPKR